MTSAQNGLTLAPRCGIGDAAGLRDTLLEALQAEGARVTVDCGAVTGIDTAMLQLLLVARRSAHAAGRELTLANPSDEFCRAVACIGLHDALMGDAAR